MPEFINNEPAGDAYSDALTLGPAADVRQISFSVVNQPALVQFAKPMRGAVQRPVWETFERLYVAGSYGVLVTNVSGVRFRNAIAGSKSSIIAELAYANDPVVQGGTVSGVGITSSGGVVPASANVQVDHNGTPVSTEPVLDFEDGGGAVWGITDDSANTRAKIGLKIGRGTVLPTTPADGDVFVLNLNATQAGLEWWCVYNASTGYWDVIAGAPLLVSPSFGGGAVAGDSAWHQITAITVPNFGDYYVEYLNGEWQTGGVNATLYSSVGTGNTPSGPQTRAEAYAGSAAIPVAPSAGRVNGVAAGGVVQGLHFTSTPATITVGTISFRATPLRIK